MWHYWRPKVQNQGAGRASMGGSFLDSSSFWWWFSCSAVPNSCYPMNCSPPGSSVCGISQARILEWVAIPSSRGSSQPRDLTQVSPIAGRFFTIWAARQFLLWAHILGLLFLIMKQDGDTFNSVDPCVIRCFILFKFLIGAWEYESWSQYFISLIKL